GGQRAAGARLATGAAGGLRRPAALPDTRRAAGDPGRLSHAGPENRRGARRRPAGLRSRAGSAADREGDHEAVVGQLAEVVVARGVGAVVTDGGVDRAEVLVERDREVAVVVVAGAVAEAAVADVHVQAPVVGQRP